MRKEVWVLTILILSDPCWPPGVFFVVVVVVILNAHKSGQELIDPARWLLFSTSQVRCSRKLIHVFAYLPLVKRTLLNHVVVISNLRAKTKRANSFLFALLQTPVSLGPLSRCYERQRKGESTREGCGAKPRAFFGMQIQQFHDRPVRQEAEAELQNWYPKVFGSPNLSSLELKIFFHTPRSHNPSWYTLLLSHGKTQFLNNIPPKCLHYQTSILVASFVQGCSFGGSP